MDVKERIRELIDLIDNQDLLNTILNLIVNLMERL